MKLTSILILFLNLQAIANVYSQTTVTLNLKSADFKKVLSTIERQSSYHFVYSERKIPGNKKISISAENEEVTAVLDQILANSGFTYSELQNHLVVITPVGEHVNAVVLKGKVVDENGLALPGASIKVKGSGAGTTTDGKGEFSIDVPDGGTLIVSYIGYKTKEITVNGNAPLTISLSPSSTLNEVVVTALGIKREARSLGYSNQKISGSDITKADPPNISQGLMGKVAGLNVTVPNGVEGGSSRIIIRGNSNLLGNNQPLIVVDGVMIDNETILPGGANLSTQNLLGQNNDVSQNQPVDYGSFLNTINANDLESINVLKGPTAAALYGARGANGVILVTTKKGSKQTGLGLAYNFTERWNDPYRYVKLQDEYGSGMTQALYSANAPFLKDGNGNNREFNENDQYGPDYGNIPGGGAFYNYIGFPGDGASWGPKMTGQPLVWWDGVTRPYTGNPNVFKSYYKTGRTTSHNVSFSGGGDVGTLRVSYTRSDNDAITYNSKSNQNVFNVGSSINVSKKVKAEATVSYINLNRLNVPNIYGEPSGVGYITTYGLPADYKPLERNLTLNPDGSQNQMVLNNAPYPSQGVQSYWWNTLENNTNFTQNQLLGSVKLIADILPWLNATGHTGINYYTNQFETRQTPTDVTGLNGKYSNDLSNVSTANMDALLTAHKESLFKDIDGSFSVGASYYHNKMYDISAYNNGPFGIPFLYNLYNYTGSNIYKPSENRLESQINSVYGLLNLSYKKYLFLELTERNDWSSTLPASNRSFSYPSASLSFVFTDALKLDAIKNWLSFGKIRIADASSANGTVPYQTAFNYNQTTFGGQSALTFPTTLPTHVNPQTSKSFEIGTELGFFDNRINVNFTYYNIDSYNQILPINIANSAGAGRITINTGSLQNRGIEFIINAKAIATKDFSWNITLNGAHNSNKVVSLSPGVDQIPLGTWFGQNGVNMNARVGDQYGTIYGYDYKYLNGQKVVNLIYADGMNTGNGAVIGAQYATTPNYVKIGNATPTLTGGLSNTFTYKNFSLYVLTDFKIGGQIWSADYSSFMGQGQAPETLKERNGGGLPFVYPDGSKGNVGVILDGVTPNGQPNTAVVNAWWKYAGNYQSWSNIPMVRSNAIFNNSWAKLRELNLSYRVPDNLIKGSKIFQGLTVSVIGRDLFYLFTKLPDNMNPESITGTGNVQGIQWNQLPGVRSFAFSVKASF
ncbi:MAG: SusC/RagA family TonB-linked outer membrane protein [Mucilaginibacter sp.]